MKSKILILLSTLFLFSCSKGVLYSGTVSELKEKNYRSATVTKTDKKSDDLVEVTKTYYIKKSYWCVVRGINQKGIHY